MVNRRRFLKYSTSAAASVLLLPRYARASRTAASNVYVVHDDSLVDGSSDIDDITDAQANYSQVKKALDSLACVMTGVAEGAKAWEALFAGITADSTIALKINCIREHNFPRYETLKALVACLSSMLDGQFKASNIHLFDNDKNGQQRVNLVYGQAELDALGVWHGHSDFNGPIINIQGGGTWRVATRLAEADFGISFGVYRPHCCEAGYLSAGIKNMLGAISYRTNTFSNTAGFHGGSAKFPMFADMYKNGMNDLVHLYLTDWLFACRDETQGLTKVPKRLVMSRDPCAIDSYATDFFHSLGWTHVVKGVPLELEKAGIGTTNYEEVGVRIGETAASHRLDIHGKTLAVTVMRHDCSYSSATFPILAGEQADFLAVYDVYGRRIRAFRLPQGRRRVMWDGLDERGRPAATGTYALRVATDRGRSLSRTISIGR